jgi:hypothetical protein
MESLWTPVEKPRTAKQVYTQLYAYGSRVTITLN